jgi:PhzF family phenazine biosynthesis protein
VLDVPLTVRLTGREDSSLRLIGSREGLRAAPYPCTPVQPGRCLHHDALPGNPVAVVLEADGLDTDAMQRFAHWTNLSETTFLLPAQDPSADYRLRIFPPVSELPFAGHPTLGSCHAWLQAGGAPRDPDMIVQECGAGLVQIRRTDTGLAFAAPPLLRSGPVELDLIARVAGMLTIDPGDVVDSQWVDNGPGWLGVLTDSAEAALALRPGVVDLDIGVVGPHPAGSPEAFEVRAFFPVDGMTVEDPVTGSLNAALAGWLTSTGRATTPYTARQGTVLGRLGQVPVAEPLWDIPGRVDRTSGCGRSAFPSGMPAPTRRAVPDQGRDDRTRALPGSSGATRADLRLARTSGAMGRLGRWSTGGVLPRHPVVLGAVASVR